MANFKFPASLTEANGRATITAFNANADEPVFIADSNHPNWLPILTGLAEGDPNVWELFDVPTAVMTKFQKVTDRVSWNGSDVLWDGDPIHSVLSDQLARAMKSGNSNDFTALAKFWEKLESNPNGHSREQAYDFLATHAFQITPEGDVVGYKGVAPTGEPGVYRSTARSRVPGVPSAFVSGVPTPPLSYVSQRVGDEVTMPRSEVTHDPSKACERGLHVATRSYAKSYGTVMRVTFNPRDIVSVPTADHGEKVRVNRYVVESIDDGSTSDAAVLRKSENTTWAGDVGYKV